MRTANRIGITSAVAILLLLAPLAYHLRADPNVVLLTPAGGADWVRADRPLDLMACQNTTAVLRLQTTFTVPPGFGGATLSVAALKRVAVSVDGARLFDTGPRVMSNWKETYAVPLPATLAVGPHRLALVVANRNGPALARVACAPLGIATSRGDWRASEDNIHWTAAVPVSIPWWPALTDEFGASAPALGRCLPLLVLLSTAPCLVLLAAAGSDRAMTRRPSRAVVVGLLTCWAATSYLTYINTG